MTLRIFLWFFTVAFYIYAEFYPCSSSFKGAQLIEVKKKRVFRNTLYLRILHFQLRQNCLGTHTKYHRNRATFTIFYRFFMRAKISRPTYIIYMLMTPSFIHVIEMPISIVLLLKFLSAHPISING